MKTKLKRWKVDTDATQIYVQKEIFTRFFVCSFNKARIQHQTANGKPKKYKMRTIECNKIKDKKKYIVIECRILPNLAQVLLGIL